MTYRSDLCQIRDLHECGCEGVCPQQRKDLPPVRTATKRDIIAVIVFGIVMSSVLFVALSAANEQIHIENLRNQEAYAHADRN